MSDLTRSWRVFFRDDLSRPSQQIAEVIARCTGVAPLDVVQKLRQSPGLAASRLTEGQSIEIVAALSQIAVRALALSEDQLVRFPDPLPVKSAKTGENALLAAGPQHAAAEPAEALQIPYSSVVFVATVMLRKATQKPLPDSENASLTWMGQDGAEGMQVAETYGFTVEPRTKTEWQCEHLLDLLSVNPTHHLRLSTSTFKFAQTGLPMQPTPVANLVQFLKAFLTSCTRASVDPSILYILDDDPLTGLRFNSPEQYDAYLFWRIQLLYNPEA